jgi:hypothetical protein
MGFASGYLDKRALFPGLISEVPDEQTGIIIVVPAYDEPGIPVMLNSLARCEEPGCVVEVLIIINAPQGASQESIDNNKLAIRNIESWRKQNEGCFFRLFYVSVEAAVKGWGVGLARKTGMDEATRRFDYIDNPGGVILNLDADCTVDPFYLRAVYEGLYLRKDRMACSIYFEHPLSGVGFPPSFYTYITLYELHLRYYYQALAYTGFPFVFHTVGSALAVRALAYVKAGGMNRRQAGEDFYFIQKLVPAGGYFSLNTTTVFPSPRASCRVPFGTGATIARMDTGKEIILFSYDLQAFKDLKTFFGLLDNAYAEGLNSLLSMYRKLPESLRLFIAGEEWTAKLTEIINNTSCLSSFKKRFFGWFNMFRVVKYLNQTHLSYFSKKDVIISALALLNEYGKGKGLDNANDLLWFYRMLEKGN